MAVDLGWMFPEREDRKEALVLKEKEDQPERKDREVSLGYGGLSLIHI